MTTPDLTRVPELLRMADLTTPMAIRAAATLRLADHLAGDPVGVDRLAALTGTRPRPLGKLLAHLVSLEIVTEPRPGRYAVTALGALLSTDNDGLGIRPILDTDHVLGRTELCMTSLLHTVRTGASAYEGAHGTSIWQYLDGPLSSAADVAVFAEATTAFDAELVVDGYHWAGVGSVVDVGGGTGALLARILIAHPHLTGTLLDLPVFADSGRANLAAAGVADRSRVVGGSFFDPLPAGADVYLLSGILPDWDDASAVRLLRRCAEAAGDHGRVLLAEVHLKAAHPDRTERTALDLRIEASMENPDRSTGEVAALGAAAGLAVTATGPSTSSRSLLELRPASASGWLPVR